MKRAILLALALSACATGPKMTVGQSLYMAYGSYGAAVHSFAEYAQSPTADPQIVHKGRMIVDSPQAKGTVAFGRAYVACKVEFNAREKGVDCTSWNFRDPAGAANALRSITAMILGTLKGTGK